MEELTAKQKLWIEHYLITRNASEAARLAGYKQPACVGHQNLIKLEAYIKPAQEAVLRELQFDKKDAISEMVAIATSDLSDIATLDNGVFKIKDFDAMPKMARRCIKSFKFKTFTNKEGETTDSVEVSLWDKTKALDMLARHMGLYEADNKQTGEAVGRLIGLPLDLEKVTGGE